MIYLDNAATTLVKPDIVCQRAIASIGAVANPGRSGHRLSLEAARQVYSAREGIATFFNIADALRVIFCCNCTDALNLAIHGTLQKGDHVVTTTMEHNSVLRPLNAIEQRVGITQTILEAGPGGIVNAEAVRQAITPQTRLVAITHASNLTGTVNPIAQIGEICHEKGVLFLVDAAQSAGCVPIDVQAMHIDLLAAPGHKALFGLQGTGFLYVGENAHLIEQKQGGTGSRSSDPFQPDLLPDRYESGTLNVPGIISLGAGVEFIAETGLEAIAAHEARLTRMMLEGLAAIPGVTLYGAADPARHVPVAAFNIAGVPSSEAAMVLDMEYDVATRSGFHCAPLAHISIGTQAMGAVRMSASFFTTEAEVAEGLRAVQAVARGAKGR
ncbi:MAG: aminotransferase class V-fold PLP-dependent enzyme [Oscillospiraceae bacterium]